MLMADPFSSTISNGIRHGKRESTADRDEDAAGSGGGWWSSTAAAVWFD
jgi:hypothetical protein